MIINSSDKNIFGGYTDIPWSKQGGKVIGKNNSFVFSIQKDGQIRKFKHVPTSNGEVFHDQEMGSFIHAIEFFIGSAISGTTSLGNFYEEPSELKYNEPTRASQSFITKSTENIVGKHFLNGGKEIFMIKEIEVYQVI